MLPNDIWKYILEFMYVDERVYHEFSRLSTWFRRNIKCMGCKGIKNKKWRYYKEEMSRLHPKHLFFHHFISEPIEFSAFAHLQVLSIHCHDKFLNFSRLTALKRLEWQYKLTCNTCTSLRSTQSICNVPIPPTVTHLSAFQYPKNMMDLGNLRFLDLRNYGGYTYTVPLKAFTDLECIYYDTTFVNLYGSSLRIKTVYVSGLVSNLEKHFPNLSELWLHNYGDGNLNLLGLQKLESLTLRDCPRIHTIQTNSLNQITHNEYGFTILPNCDRLCIRDVNPKCKGIFSDLF